MIYLDNAATTFPKPEEVYEAVEYVQRNLAVNVGRGSYEVASQAMQIMDETRYLLAQKSGIDNPNNVILTPSATVAANEIIFGLEWDSCKTVYITPFEHNAIARPLERIRENFGINVRFLPFDSKTHKLDVSRTRVLFSRDKPDYIFINHVSNVTGTILPIREVAFLAKEYEATIIVDASQSMGLIDIDMIDDEIDYLIFAGHKNLYSSFGVGGFISKETPTLKPVFLGGTGSNSLDLTMGMNYPTMYEPGSPNIIAIASLNASLKWLNNLDYYEMQIKKEILCQELISGLQEIGCLMYLPEDLSEHTEIVSFNVNGYTANEVGSILSNEFDIAVRTGYHCAPYIHDFLDTKRFEGTVRASIGFFNTEEDINSLITAIKDL